MADFSPSHLPTPFLYLSLWSTPGCRQLYDHTNVLWSYLLASNSINFYGTLPDYLAGLHLALLKAHYPHSP